MVLGVVPGTVGPQSFAAQPVAGGGDSDQRPIVPAASAPVVTGRHGDVVPATGVPAMAARTALSVTGAGTVSAPAGALVLAPAEPGSGEFALRAERAAGGAAPAGNVAFVWAFGADRYEIVSTPEPHLLTDGGAARRDGACAINGVNGFTFTVLIVPSRKQDGEATQRLRLQVRDATTETVGLDTQPGTALAADLEAASELAAGRVTILTAPRD